MFKRLISVVFFLVLLAAAPTDPPLEISYNFDLQQDEDRTTVKITVNFTGEDDGTTFVSLPDSWGGQEGLYQALSGYKCNNEGCTFGRTRVATALLITHKPGEVISLTYTVHQDWVGDLTRQIAYRPILTNDYVFMIGEAVIVVPDNYKGQAAKVKLTWQNLPEDWSRINSFGEGNETSTDVKTLDEVVHSLFIAGDFNIRTVDVKGQTLKIAVRGEWNFSLEDFYQLAEKVMVSERTFWDDFAAPYYLITMIPTQDKCCSFGGTSLNDTFSLFISGDASDASYLRYLLSHELMHNWIGITITTVQPEEYMYWFTEGFTDYYTRLINLRAGIIDLEGYVQEYNQAIEAYFISSARNYTKEDVREKFWQDQPAQKLPYQQGDILAHNWNVMIRAGTSGKTLDQIMKNILDKAHAEPTQFDAQILDALFRPYMTGGILGDVNSHINKGETIYPDAAALGACFMIEDQEKIPFDLGFEYTNSPEENVYWDIISVDPGSPAEEAGIKAGMSVFGYSFFWGDINNPIELKILDGDQVSTVSYLGRGEPLLIPQYVPADDTFAENPDVCLAWFQS